MLHYGEEFSAQKMKPKSVRISFGDKNPLSLSDPDKKLIYPIISDYLSYDLVKVVSTSSLSTNQIILAPCIDPLLNNKQDSPKSVNLCLKFPIGIYFEVCSPSLGENYSGLFHRYFIRFLNELIGCEYTSVNYHPIFNIDNNFPQFDSWNALFQEIMKLLIQRFKTAFSEIQSIQYHIALGQEEVESHRKIYDPLINLARTRTFEQIHKRSPHDLKSWAYVLNFDQDRSPLAALFITPYSVDPIGYLNYADLDSINWFSSKLEQYQITRLPIGEMVDIQTKEFPAINSFITKFSYGLVNRIQLHGFAYPLPLPPNFELCLFVFYLQTLTIAYKR